MTKEQIEAIETRWSGRVKEMGYKPKSKAYRTAQAEFFAGAMTAAVAVLGEAEGMVPYWIICIMSGRDILNKG